MSSDQIRTTMDDERARLLRRVEMLEGGLRDAADQLMQAAFTINGFMSGAGSGLRYQKAAVKARALVILKEPANV